MEGSLDVVQSYQKCTASWSMALKILQNRMNDSDTLLCQEDEFCLNENGYKDVNLGLCSVSECVNEYI